MAPGPSGAGSHTEHAVVHRLRLQPTILAQPLGDDALTEFRVVVV